MIIIICVFFVCVTAISLYSLHKVGEVKPKLLQASDKDAGDDSMWMKYTAAATTLETEAIKHELEGLRYLAESTRKSAEIYRRKAKKAKKNNE